MAAQASPLQEPVRLRRLLYVAAFSRALGTGLVGVLIGLYLARAGLDPRRIGFVLAAALWGGALAALLVTLFGARFAFRTQLVLLSGATAVCAIAFARADDLVLLMTLAFVGMFNVVGRDRGAVPIIEQALFPATASDAERTLVFARYNVVLDSGYALGGLLAGIPTLLVATAGMDELAAMRWTILLYALLYAVATALYLRVPPVVATGRAVSIRGLSPASRPIVRRIAFLFLIDAIGGGFLGSALLSYFFAQQFAVSAATLALLIAAGRSLAAFSHLGAAWLAARIGLVNTMVWTHVPSSLILFTIGVAPDFTIAAILFLVREALNEMDVPTRQSYVMAVVQPEERLATAGVTNLVRACGWAIAPVFAGLLMQTGSLAAPLYCGASLKILYDVLLWWDFRRLKPPEES